MKNVREFSFDLDILYSHVEVWAEYHSEDAAKNTKKIKVFSFKQRRRLTIIDKYFPMNILQTFPGSEDALTSMEQLPDSTGSSGAATNMFIMSYHSLQNKISTCLSISMEVIRGKAVPNE